MKKAFVIFTLLFICIFFNSCKKEEINQPEEHQQKLGKLTLSIDKANAPKDVIEVLACLSREGYDTLKSSMNLLTDSTAGILLNDVAVGKWHLKVDAMNQAGYIIYSGESDVDVQEEVTIQVNLTLSPTGVGVGNINISVKWGKYKMLTLQPEGETGKDALISLLRPDNNFGENYSDFILYAGTNDGEVNKYRDLLEFNLSSLKKNTQIHNAFLSLYYNSTTGFGWGGQAHSGQNSFKIERIISPWTETTVTWNTQPSTTDVNSVIVPASENPYGDYLNIDVKNLIQDIVNNPDNSHGMMLKLVNETPYAQVILCSSDYSVPAKRPKLVLQYY